MKKLLAVLVIAGIALSSQATLIYDEDFNDAGLAGKGMEGDSGTPTTTNMSGVTSFSVERGTGFDLEGDSSLNWFRVESGQFQAQDVEGFGIWLSEDLDVTSYSTADIQFDFSVLGPGKNAGADYGFEWGYELDGVYTRAEDIGELGEGDAIDESTVDGTTRSVSGIDVSSASILNVRIEMGANGADDGYNFDNVQVNAIPEPSTFAMFGIALGLIGLIRRRRS